MNELSLKITNEQKHIPFTPTVNNLSVTEKQKLVQMLLNSLKVYLLL
jgi:hypothetical protein